MANQEHASGNEASAIIDVIDDAIEEHDQWLQRWHRTIVVGGKPPGDVVSENAQFNCRLGVWLDINKGRGLVDQPAFQELDKTHSEMHDFARLLAQGGSGNSDGIQDNATMSVEDYDELVGRVDRFKAAARRILEAFRKAAVELDPLTGVQNRRVMMAELEREQVRAARTNSPCCIAIADIDRFKEVNDEHGHQAGDRVLLHVAGSFLACMRPYDGIYRYGGEEFIIVLPDTDLRSAQIVADRLRAMLEETPAQIADGGEVAVTASMGLAMIEDDVPVTETIARADRALYAAKDGGRNRVEVWRKGMADDD